MKPHPLGCAGLPRSHAAAGFVLPVTVILLALIAVGVALMSHRSDQLRDLVMASRQEQQAAAAVQNTLAQAMYLSSTLYRRGKRMGDIVIDGRYYRTADGIDVSYLDAGALFNLRRARPTELVGLLLALGIGDAKADRLSDTLLDYVDADSLVRLNGAEAPEYAAAKMPPPRNNFLLMPTELQRIVGWHDLDAATLNAVLDNVYVGTVGNVNRNTVRAPVLAALGGTDIASARALIAQRDAGQPLAIESLPSVVHGSFFSVGRYITLPSSTLLISICPPAVAWCQRVSLTATADDGLGPWHVDYSIRVTRTVALPASAQVEALPDQPPKHPPPPLFTPFGNQQ
ncbi:MAG: general secretion pathway protein GspK [Burkholderiales bacterium]|nr:general secretion pathway protein GspK [Burkholderiales bacterium]